MTARADEQARPAGAGTERDDRSRLTALQGLAALSLDALSSVAYGPGAIVIVVVAAGSVGLGYTGCGSG